jgi:K+-sensing histidine kinase KdpD
LTLFQRHRSWVMFVLALVVPLFIALALVPSRTEFAGVAAALIFVAAIVALAVAGNRFTGFIASASSALWYDFFLTRPYDRLYISHDHDVETTVCLLVVGVMVSELAARSRHYSMVSAQESGYVDMVRELTDVANRRAPSSAIIEQAISTLVPLLSLRECRFDRQPSDPPMARIVQNGDVHHVGMEWPVGELGIPGPEAKIVAEWRGRALGRFVITPTPGEPVSRERRVVSVLLASVVGAALASDVRAA